MFVFFELWLWVYSWLFIREFVFERIPTFNLYDWLLWNYSQYSGFKNIVKTPYTLYQKYLTEITMIFLDCKSMLQAKSKMKPKFPVPKHHDISLESRIFVKSSLPPHPFFVLPETPPPNFHPCLRTIPSPCLQ